LKNIYQEFKEIYKPLITHNLMEGAYITGFGEHLEKESKLSFFELFAKASLQALDSSGLSLEEVDGFVMATATNTIEDPPIRNLLIDQVSSYIGLNKLEYLELVDIGGSSFNAMIFRAYRAIRDGLATSILVVGGGKGTIRKKSSRADLVTRYSFKPHEFTEYSPTSDYAMIALRYSHEFGVGDEKRALIAVRERGNAKLNPNALYREPIDVKDVLNSPMVSYPLRLLECTRPIDGASAFILTNKEKSKKGKYYPVKVLGYGEFHDPRPIIERESILLNPVEVSSRKAFNLSGIKSEEIDVFMLYDAFTIMVVLEIEGIGLAEKGKAWKFVEENDFSPNSPFPINTNGGTLNTGQPAYMSGGVILTEALRQLNGVASGRQVEGANKALINGIGGILNHSTTIILGV
jgi:acetyl-CoA acetyltransferase